jgi:hypothetical protein
MSNIWYDFSNVPDDRQELMFRARNLSPICCRAPVVVLAALALSACATSRYAPEPLGGLEQSASYQSSSRGEVTVAVAVLTDEEARRHFDADLGAFDVQALWIRVRNASTRRYWFVRNSTDPDLYSADEAARLVKSEVHGDDFETLRQYLRDESIRVLMEPGHITQGFIFLPREEGGRYVEIRLASDAYESGLAEGGRSGDGAASPAGHFRELRFSFALTLPDGEFDYERLDTTLTYAGQYLPDLGTAALRGVLEALPCCVTNPDGDRNGDPLNVVLVGETQDLMNSLSRCGWSFTHRITPDTIRRMMAAALRGEGYPVAPVSSLYAFGRKQDIALQRARRNIAQRNHMRLWLAPFRHEGRSVFVGQISRDIGVKMTPKSPTLTTHVIDPEVDLTREYLLHSLLAEGFVERFGFVGGSTFAGSDDPAFNLTGDPYFSDGLRLVVVLSPQPVPYTEVRSLLWEQSDAPVAESQTEAANRNVWPIGSEKFEER